MTTRDKRYEHNRPKADVKILAIHHHPKPRSVAANRDGGTWHVAVQLVEANGHQRCETGYVFIGKTAADTKFMKWAFDREDVEARQPDELFAGLRRMWKREREAAPKNAPTALPTPEPMVLAPVEQIEAAGAEAAP